MVRLPVLELDPCVVSPGYDAVIVYEPSVLDAPLNVAVQVPLESPQLAGKPVGPLVKVTVPVALVEYPLSVLDTVTVHVVDPV